MLALLALAACGRGAEGGDPVVLGVGSTTEQHVLAALTVVALDRAGIPTEVRTELGGTVGLRREAGRGAIDLFWDYTGAAWALGLGEHAPPADPNESYQRVRRADEDFGLEWLPPTTANATLALFVRSEDLPPTGEPRGLTWLAGVLSGGEAALCADPDFIRRPGGLDALAEAYAIGRDRLRLVGAAEEDAIERVAAGECFAGLATATSGRARLEGLHPVSDDLRLFPAFVIAPVARAAALERHDGLAEALAPLVALLDTQSLALLNARVEGGDDPEDVAEEFLSAGLDEEPAAALP